MNDTGDSRFINYNHALSADDSHFIVKILNLHRGEIVYCSTSITWPQKDYSVNIDFDNSWFKKRSLDINLATEETLIKQFVDNKWLWHGVIVSPEFQRQLPLYFYVVSMDTHEIQLKERPTPETLLRELRQ